MSIQIPRSTGSTTATTSTSATAPTAPTAQSAAQPPSARPATGLTSGDAFVTSTRSGAGATGTSDATARDQILQQAADAINKADKFQSLDDGRQLSLNDSFDPRELKDLRGEALQNLQALATQQPPLSPAELQDAATKVVKKFLTDCAFEKKINDFFIDQIIQQMNDNMSEITEALSG